jgi:hypothetical protein
MDLVTIYDTHSGFGPVGEGKVVRDGEDLDSTTAVYAERLGEGKFDVRQMFHHIARNDEIEAVLGESKAPKVFVPAAAGVRRAERFVGPEVRASAKRAL